MQVKRSEFEQFYKLNLVNVESSENNEGVTIIWYDNPPVPKEPLKIEKGYSWQRNSYTLQVNEREQRKVVAMATILRPSANKYKVTFYKCASGEEGVKIEMLTCCNYDEIVAYLQKEIKSIKQ